MKLSAAVIIEYLSEWVIDSALSEEGGAEFSGVRVFTGMESSLEDDILYVCERKLLYETDRSKFEGHCFVIKPCPYDYQPGSAIILSESSNMRVVTNTLIELFEKINRFERLIKQATVMHKGYDPYFEVAKQMLPGCLIVMTDSAYSLVSSTMHSVPQNEYLDGIVQRGFYNKTDLDLMASKGYFEDDRKYKAPVLYEAGHTISGLPFVVRSYRMYGATASFVGCYFLESAPTLFDLTAFKCLTDEIGSYMFANGMYDDNMPTKQRMIDDLISEKRNDPDFFYDRCAKLHIPFEGDFRLGLIQTETDNIIKAAQMVNQLSTYCFVQNFGVFQHVTSVIILFRDWHNYDVKEIAGFEENWQSLMGSLRANHAQMGISLSFKTIDQFGIAYRQAQNAMSQGKLRSPGCDVYFYSEYYVYDMLQNYDNVIPLNNVYTCYLEELDDGKSNSCSNLELLYVYLISERNIALTARRVHMHRNGVLYRIQKIQYTLGLDLDSADVRLRLLLSFKILDMKGRIDLRQFDERDGDDQIMSME